jgi:large exoprotein involved in heme utilization and adhesion
VNSYTRGQGNAGSVNINARDTVSFTQNAGLVSYTNGRGNASSVNINAYNTVSFDNGFVNNIVLSDGVGNAGDINITTGSLSLTNGSVLLSSTAGQGSAGSVNINARDRVSIDGKYYDIGRYYVSYASSGIRTQVSPVGVGHGGNVTIATGSLFLTNGGAVNTSTQGQGNAGRVTIHTRDSAQISGTAPTLPDRRSEVLTSAAPGSVGRGGNVSITTRSLTVLDQGRINTNVQGQGEAGNTRFEQAMLSRSMAARSLARLTLVQWVEAAILPLRRHRSPWPMVLNSRLPPLEKASLVISHSAPIRLG